ncbi:CopG family ribbon-helix-helix protein [Geoalkalibacter halelectricus]|uniref:Ribbon-helix-helix protein, CopG family n=1 Tax=Geoalkalibacter halelectricus TaxID=2847045 RepID=A0ABY5ZQY2_9BACT|nr:ribbon-helix-helix protein, CopG family [Geoalkalibacter halelectricus]MDO3377959.1 ribbon-helix-helix protein, CopG family [Geoalkalibacter halelectricus]UWZ81538.1 ribbon-helix-helix protein, CopG family [Geoalkalibacter halelectricus]
MAKTKIAVTLDEKIVNEVDQLVSRRAFPSRSRIIEDAVREKLARMARNRLAQECTKLDPRFEKSLAEEGLGEELAEWPEY